MLKFFRNLFCNHIYQNVERFETRKIREHSGSIGYLTYQYYAVKQKCLKCKKERYIEIRNVVL